jgi:glycosyltransferase involved in cell wall biosynthesis
MDIIGNIVTQSYADSLLRYSKGLSISFHASMSDKKKEAIMKRSQFFWHANGLDRIKPEQTEHFGIAPEEALKCGCLTYVHRSGGAKDFCKSWETLEELRDITLSALPNNRMTSFSNHEKTVDFWKEVLI